MSQSSCFKFWESVSCLNCVCLGKLLLQMTFLLGLHHSICVKPKLTMSHQFLTISIGINGISWRKKWICYSIYGKSSHTHTHTPIFTLSLMQDFYDYIWYLPFSHFKPNGIFTGIYPYRVKVQHTKWAKRKGINMFE